MNHHDRLSDAQLDALLAVAHHDLQRHSQDNTNPSAALSALFDPPAARPDDAAASRARALIDLRLRARDLRPGTSTDFCERIHAADAPCDVAYLAFLLGISTATHKAVLLREGRPRALGLARGIAMDLAVTFDLARGIALAHGIVGDLDLDRYFTLEYDRYFTHALDLARALAYALDFALAHALDLALDLTPARDLVRALAFDIDHGRTHALEHTSSEVHDVLARMGRVLLDAAPVDASGLDLSDLRLPDIDVLAGVTWTKQTIWPDEVRAVVEDRSTPIRPGVYRVCGGREHDPRSSALL